MIYKIDVLKSIILAVIMYRKVNSNLKKNNKKIIIKMKIINQRAIRTIVMKMILNKVIFKIIFI